MARVRLFKTMESSNLAEVYYHRELKNLYIVFNSGSMYVYYGVSYYRYRQLMKAPSKGQYFNRNIKNIYHYRKVEEP